MIERDEEGVLGVGGRSLVDIAALHGTPLYVYSADMIRARYRLLREIFGPSLAAVHYSVKAWSNLSALRLLAAEGAGFDVVSRGEVERCRAAGIDPARLVFAGVGKTDEELEHALRVGVGTFNVESREEWDSLVALARRLGLSARFALRVNPDVDARTHRYITTGRGHNKFGMRLEEAWAVLDEDAGPLRFHGFHLHIGSQITHAEPLIELVEAARGLVEEAGRRGHAVQGMNLGGGLGVRYRTPGLDIDAVRAELRPRLERLGVPISLEPGRFLVAEAGLLLTRVVRCKEGHKRFVVVDAGMNDLMRPALYQAEHEVVAVEPRPGTPRAVDVVGPICESADFFGHDRELPPVESGDLLAVLSAGAYGSSMASQYNSRPRPAEVLVDGGQLRVVRRRERESDLYELELDVDDPS